VTSPVTENHFSAQSLKSVGFSEPRTLWERVALTRWGQYLSKIEEEAILQAEHLAGVPGEALEVGCEGGRWSKMLADKGWNLTCVDVNPEALKECRAKLPAANLILSDTEATTISVPDRNCSLVLCVEVAPVIQSDWFLPEAYRVMKSGGIMIGVVWNRTSIRGYMHRRRCRSDGKPGEANIDDFYSESYLGWRKRLTKAGFKLVKTRGCCWAPFGRSSDSRLIPFFTGFEQALGLRWMTALSPWVIFIARKP